MDPMEETSSPSNNEPMTIPERIHRLNEIDKNIVLLMSHTTNVLTALSPQPDSTAEAQEQAFQRSMNDMLTTLHAVDVHMKRQIWALEEAGIIRLPAAAEGKSIATGGGVGGGADADARSAAARSSSLEPNGVGSIGGLDVGWLNSRNNKVERDMEAELWGRARRLLEKISRSEEGKMEE